MKTAKYTAYGALVGLCIGLLLSFIADCGASFNCAGTWIEAFFGCGDATCASGCQEFISDPIVRNCILYSTIICTVIGGTYGAFQTLQDKNAVKYEMELKRSASAKKQRATWAGEVKQKALNVNNTCSKNKASVEQLVSTSYKSSTQMADIMNELTKVAEKQGKVDSLAEELSKRGGASV